MPVGRSRRQGEGQHPGENMRQLESNSTWKPQEEHTVFPLPLGRNTTDSRRDRSHRGA